jgi:hypothetical protein
MVWFFLLALIEAQPVSVNWDERRASENGKSPFISRIVEYRPAPGQFINDPGIGTREAAESIVGGIDGLVSLGNFGGYIVVGFDHTVWNDPKNPYGVDFTVLGNAMSNSSEPGIVMVMADTNGNSLADDTWYELKGSHYDSASTVHHYTITYTNPKQAGAVPWTDNRGETGSVKFIPEHDQPYYPLPDFFPAYPQDETVFSGSLLNPTINDSNPQFVRIKALPFGYADNLPFTGTAPPYIPDNPATYGVLEGNGGNAFDIDWAVDEDGHPVYLEGIDFIKIYTATNVNAGWLGELSTEVCGIIDVSPDDITAAPLPEEHSEVQVYPNPASEYIHIQSDKLDVPAQVEIWDITGQLKYRQTAANALFTVSVANYPEGVYIVRIKIRGKWINRKISVFHN